MQLPVICYGIIVAGGMGTRMGTATKKQYLPLGDMPVLSRTIQVFDQCSLIDQMLLVVSEDDVSFCQENIIAPFGFCTPVSLIAGGKSRQESVYNGLVAARQMAGSEKDKKQIVMVHDGVRPLVRDSLIRACVGKALDTGACIPVLPSPDTVKFLDAGKRRVWGTLDRKSIGLAQTPQAFDMDILWAAFLHARKTKFTGTDEASLLEHAGKMVSIVAGHPENIKITTMSDLTFARYLLENHEERGPLHFL